MFFVLSTGDDLFTDVYKIKLVNGVLYEVEGKVFTYVHVSIHCLVLSMHACMCKCNDEG